MNATGRQKPPSHGWRYMFGSRCSCTSRRCSPSPNRFALPKMPLYLDTTQELPKQLSHSDCRRLTAIRTWVAGRTLTKPYEVAKRKAPFFCYTGLANSGGNLSMIGPQSKAFVSYKDSYIVSVHPNFEKDSRISCQWQLLKIQEFQPLHLSTEKDTKVHPKHSSRGPS